MPTIEEAKNAIIITTSNLCHCQKDKCRYIWISVKEELPVQCALCHSPTWWMQSKAKLKKGKK